MSHTTAVSRSMTQRHHLRGGAQCNAARRRFQTNVGLANVRVLAPANRFRPREIEQLIRKQGPTGSWNRRRVLERQTRTQAVSSAGETMPYLGAGL